MSTLRQALTEALAEYTTNLHEVALIEAIASRALRQWLEAEGLVVVPGEATIAMTHAVWTTDLPRPDMHGDYSDLDVQMAARDIWRSMISAAPDALAKDAPT
jgi:hypothetical protein